MDCLDSLLDPQKNTARAIYVVRRPFRIRPDGTDLQQVIPDAYDYNELGIYSTAYSFDGQWMVFTGDDGTFVARTDGTDIKMLLPPQKRLGPHTFR